MQAARTQPISVFPFTLSLLAGSRTLNPSQTMKLKNRVTSAAKDKSNVGRQFLGPSTTASARELATQANH